MRRPAKATAVQAVDFIPDREEGPTPDLVEEPTQVQEAGRTQARADLAARVQAAPIPTRGTGHRHNADSSGISVGGIFGGTSLCKPCKT